MIGTIAGCCAYDILLQDLCLTRCPPVGVDRRTSGRPTAQIGMIHRSCMQGVWSEYTYQIRLSQNLTHWIVVYCCAQICVWCPDPFSFEMRVLEHQNYKGSTREKISEFCRFKDYKNLSDEQRQKKAERLKRKQFRIACTMGVILSNFNENIIRVQILGQKSFN